MGRRPRALSWRPYAIESQPAMNERDRRLARRNLRTALWLTLAALGFYGMFFFSMSHRGG